MRALKILLDRLKTYNFRELVILIIQNIHYSEPILVYRQEINSVNRIENNYENNDLIIEKGNAVLLDNETNNINPVPWEYKCNVFDGVTDFFVARNNQGIQHISWIYYYSDRNRLLSLEKDEVEIKFCLTLPALRGQGVYPKVVKSMIHYLADNGYKAVYMCVHPENKASIRGIEKAGFDYAGNLRLQKILGFQVSPRLKTLGLSKNENS